MSQITTHILDTAKGRPAKGVLVVLERQVNESWEQVATGRTNDDGRISDLCTAGEVLSSGCYRLRFATAAYFEATGEPPFYPWVEISFQIGDDGQHYHIPLLLSPFGYSTYRGS